MKSSILLRFKKDCKRALKLYRAGYLCRELVPYRSSLPDKLTLKQVQYFFSLYYGYLSYHDFKREVKKLESED